MLVHPRAAQTIIMCFSAFMSSAPAHAEPSRSESTWPKGYSIVTLQSGHSYKVLNSGPVIGKGGKRLGMGVSYISSAGNFDQLKSAAQDLFEYVRLIAEQQHDDSIIVMAKLGFDPNAFFSRSTDFGIVYEREPSGTWRQLKVDESKPFPDVPPAANQADSPDSHAEALAKADADAWLSLVDAGKFEESWNAASPYLKQVTTKAGWVKSGAAIRSAVGKLVSRTQISTMETGAVPSAPPGRYVVFEFHTRYSNRLLAIESVVETLCEDGKWRIAGYALR